MEILDLKSIISKRTRTIKIYSPREMAPIYNIGNSYKRWFDRRFGSHYIELYVDDISLVKPEGEIYDALYIKDEIFGNITVKSIEFDKGKGSYYVRLKAEKVAITSRVIEIV